MATGDGCRAEGPAAGSVAGILGGFCASTDDLSGYVVGSPTNYFIDIGDVNPGGDNAPGLTVTAGTSSATLFPLGYTASFVGLCDAEMVDGDGIADESEIEGSDPDGSTGPFPDGTWDDGGVGCVTHSSYHYGDASQYGEPGSMANPDDLWDTESCGLGDTLKGKDALGDVWIGAFCDSVTTGTGGSVSGCITNAILGSPTDPVNVVEEVALDPDSCLSVWAPTVPNRVAAALGCITGAPADPLAKPGCVSVALQGTAIETNCKAGGGGDEPVTYGLGSVGVPLPGLTTCTLSSIPHFTHQHGTQWGFTMILVDAEADALVGGSPGFDQNGSLTVIPVTHGWLDQ